MIWLICAHARAHAALYVLFIDCVRYLFEFCRAYSLRLCVCVCAICVWFGLCGALGLIVFRRSVPAGSNAARCNGNPLCGMENGRDRRDEGKCVRAAYAFHSRTIYCMV